MSAINTGTINVNYPTPGVNNSSQGFRDNFTGIKNNLDTASSELTDLQNKAVVKSALDGTTLNNDMNNTLISNALTLNFRATTFSLGNNLSGLVTVDLTKGDVQYGTVTGNISLEFAKWAPTGTQSKVQLMLTVASPTLQITLPTSVTIGKSTIENCTGNVITVLGSLGLDTPSVLHYTFTTIDCGTTVEIIPMNRPRVATQLTVKTPANSKGVRGDKAGTVTVDSSYLYVCVANWDGTTDIWKRVALAGGAW
jgi:hypothetical protein